MSPEELKANVRRITEEAWNKGNLDALDEYYAANIVRHQPPFPDIVGIDSLKQFFADVRTAYSGWQVTGDEIIVEGDTVATRGLLQGTHTGQSPTFRFPPTGKQMTTPYCNVGHLVDGKCVEEWAYVDYLGML